MNKTCLLVLMFLTASSGALNAASTLTVTVNTSLIDGTDGSLDFQFNPGPLVTQPATVQILGFSGGSYGGSDQLNGAVTGGPLPSPVTINNTDALNEYFQAFNFGPSLRFTLSFNGPAIDAPDGKSTSGSVFSFSMFSDRAGTVPVLTSDPNGVAATVAVGLDGSLTAATLSPAVSVTPEPTSVALCAAAMGLLALLTSLRRRLN